MPVGLVAVKSIINRFDQTTTGDKHPKLNSPFNEVNPMSETLSKPSVRLTHNQRARVAKGHGLFKRQYICLITDTRSDSIGSAWSDYKRSLRAMRRDGDLDDVKARSLMSAGREQLDEHVQVLADELDAYDMLYDYLKRVTG